LASVTACSSLDPDLFKAILATAVIDPDLVAPLRELKSRLQARVMAEAGDPALAMIVMVAIDFLHFERLMRLPPQDSKLRAMIAERLRRPGSRPPRTSPSRLACAGSPPRSTAWRRAKTSAS
jgi:hypothetical protein